ncbi:MAG: hypothetical protein LC115_02780 [Bacteroidia bacterium]|nr:hypothetical protein [Bacteroidia bacterium]
MRLLTAILFLIALKSYTQNQEPHLRNIKQLTFGGDNAEAYFSFDGKKLVFQSNNPAWGLHCDQIYSMVINQAIKKGKGYLPPKISTGKGKTTCSYFLKDNQHILYASTHLQHENCPPPPPPRPDRKYLWALNPEFDIFIADNSGKITKQLTDVPGYDAEATVSPKGDKIVFTSVRNGDLDLYVMDIDGSNVKQITHELGYDGGAFFSPDGKQLIFRASRPKTEVEIDEYKQLLAQNLVAPTNMEIFVCDIDGQNMRQITHLGKANWAPFFHPSGKKVLFSSNHHSEKGYDFQLYMIDIDGKNLHRITEKSLFNAFPMFSPDGKKLVFSSNRDNGGTHDTNVFIADWVENP